MKRYLIILLLSAKLIPSFVAAQHEHKTHVADSAKQKDLPEMRMSSAILPGLSMQRDGSGTSWHPDSSPMRAIHRQVGAWALMYHGSVFGRYTNQNAGESGKRGDNKFSAPNWFMLMAQRPTGKHGQIMLRSMISFDRLTEGGDGYPLLFQTGESWKGQPLIDRQHPHDLFAELAVAYGHSLGKEAGFFLYFGLPGEPAIGPPVFMHRPSAQSNPDAPLGHHWQDATHITFGVATAGVRYKIAKLEGSLFTGREPNENRYNFDKPRFDSNSFRLSINPTANLALQISSGFLKSPEALEPSIDVRRTSASMLYNRAFGNGKNFIAALVWGQNDPESEKQNSYLLESELQLMIWNRFTARSHSRSPCICNCGRRC